MKNRPFDKYWYYRNAVQSPEADVLFLRNLYRRIRHRDPKVLREDFCGTFANLCEWVRLGPKFRGVGVDLDHQPLEYGKKNYLAQLKPNQQKRIKLIEGDVRGANSQRADIVVAMNFSYFSLRQREDLRTYFLSAHRHLNRNGLFVVDCFGGSECLDRITDRTRKRGYWYLWEQANYFPVGNRAKFHIHFKRDGEKIRKRVFTYDWRMWSIPEVSDLMKDAGFSRTLVYWQDDDEVFRPSNNGEPCASWLAYIVGLK